MSTSPLRWDDIPLDSPIALLTRRKVQGENILAAQIFLEKGCVVPRHSHESEQFAIMLSGRVRWTLGDEETEVEMTAGQVLPLPSNFVHGLLVLEDSAIIDILSPPGPMGVDHPPLE